jgi:hypothetical protein
MELGSDPHWPSWIELFTRIKIGCGLASASVLPTESDLFPIDGSIPPSGRADKASGEGQEAIKQSFEDRRGDYLHRKERGGEVFVHFAV